MSMVDNTLQVLQATSACKGRDYSTACWVGHVLADQVLSMQDTTQINNGHWEAEFDTQNSQVSTGSSLCSHPMLLGVSHTYISPCCSTASECCPMACRLGLMAMVMSLSDLEGRSSVALLSSSLAMYDCPCCLGPRWCLLPKNTSVVLSTTQFDGDASARS